jgi:hypothetical protein
VISRFRGDVDEICALLGYYTALRSSSLPKFLGLLDHWNGTGCPKTSVQNYQSTLPNIPEEHGSYPLLSGKVNCEVYTVIILSVVFMRAEAPIGDFRGRQLQEAGQKCITCSCITVTSEHVLFWWPNREWCVCEVSEQIEIHKRPCRGHDKDIITRKT